MKKVRIYNPEVPEPPPEFSRMQGVFCEPGSVHQAFCAPSGDTCRIDKPLHEPGRHRSEMHIPPIGAAVDAKASVIEGQLDRRGHAHATRANQRIHGIKQRYFDVLAAAVALTGNQGHDAGCGGLECCHVGSHGQGPEEGLSW